MKIISKTLISIEKLAPRGLILSKTAERHFVLYESLPKVSS